MFPEKALIKSFWAHIRNNIYEKGKTPIKVKGLANLKVFRRLFTLATIIGAGDNT